MAEDKSLPQICLGYAIGALVSFGILILLVFTRDGTIKSFLRKTNEK